MPDDLSIYTLKSTLKSSSLWALFWQADIVVQGVMLILFVASVMCWAITFSKILTLRSSRASILRFEKFFSSGGPSLQNFLVFLNEQKSNPLNRIFTIGLQEWKKSTNATQNLANQSKEALQQRIERVMNIRMAREIEFLEKNMGFLASIGSTAPFIGLFGTVWGIMHSFQGIAASQSTNLAVVAPGIAEALFATALGLVTAIPAVLVYNKFASDITQYATRLEELTAELMILISHQIDRK